MSTAWHGSARCRQSSAGRSSALGVTGVDATSSTSGGRQATEADEHTGSPGKLDLVEFRSSPFPYRGDNPGLNRPFLDVNSNNRLGHSSVRGGVYWEDQTYSD